MNMMPLLAMRVSAGIGHNIAQARQGAIGAGGVHCGAATTIAQATQIYLRYDGELASGTDNHALNVGVRISW
jgi:hypothetical protein